MQYRRLSAQAQRVPHVTWAGRRSRGTLERWGIGRNHARTHKLLTELLQQYTCCGSWVLMHRSLSSMGVVTQGTRRASEGLTQLLGS